MEKLTAGTKKVPNAQTVALTYTYNPCTTLWETFHSLLKPQHVTASHFFLRVKPPERGRAVLKNQKTKQRWACHSQSTYATGLSNYSYISVIVA